MTDMELVMRYAPIVHFDLQETIPLRAIGYTVFHTTQESRSFPGRKVEVEDGGCAIEYAYYWDYDIEHGYDLEHIWIYVDQAGEVSHAEGSFHGKYLNLLIPALPACLPVVDHHVQAFCQPGKHAFLMDGNYFRLVPGWDTCCSTRAGGPILIGNPFCAQWSPTGEDLFQPTAEEDARCDRYLHTHLAFAPGLVFDDGKVPDVPYMPWQEMFEKIPGWVRDECERLRKLGV